MHLYASVLHEGMAPSQMVLSGMVVVLNAPVLEGHAVVLRCVLKLVVLVPEVVQIVVLSNLVRNHVGHHHFVDVVFQVRSLRHVVFLVVLVLV